MTIPIIKLLLILVKNFTKPVINFAKSATKKTGFTPLSRFLMHSGNAEYQVTARINRAFSGSAGRKSRIRPLTDELAQERGAELWGEIVIYGTFIGMAVWEYKKS